MKDRLEADLTAWEMGKLSFEELDARYPGMRMLALADLDERLRTAAAIPVPDPESSWERLAARLPEREMAPELEMAPERAREIAPVREPVRPASLAAWRRMRRPLVAALAAVLLFGSAALAAPGPVRAGFDAVRRSLASLVGGGGGGSGAPVPPASVAPPALAPSVSPEAESDAPDEESPEPDAEESADAGEDEGETVDQESGAAQESGDAEEDAVESPAPDGSESEDEETSADPTDSDSPTDGEESSDSAEGESVDSDGVEGSATLAGPSLRPLA